SASSCCESVVEPTRSQKRTVSWRRSPAGRVSRSLVAAARAHASGPRRAPPPPQDFSPAPFAAPPHPQRAPSRPPPPPPSPRADPRSGEHRGYGRFQGLQDAQRSAVASRPGGRADVAGGGSERCGRLAGHDQTVYFDGTLTGKETASRRGPRRRQLVRDTPGQL